VLDDRSARDHEHRDLQRRRNRTVSIFHLSAGLSASSLT
jgi:hypothetical protein